MKKKFLTYSMFMALVGLGISRANAQQTLKIGNNPTTVTNSAVLDVEANNKGVLLPRVALTDLADIVTIPSPANSLTVYNTATAGSIPNNVLPGYYYWNATTVKWVRLNDHTYNNGLTLASSNQVGLGGQLDIDTKIYFNDKSLTLLKGEEGSAFPGGKSIGFSTGGLRLRYNDGGAGDASGTDSYLSIQNTRTVNPTVLQLGTPYDLSPSGIKSIFTNSNNNNTKLVGGQFGVLNEQTSGTNQEQVGIVSKSSYTGGNTAQITKTIGGYFESENPSATNTGNYAIYARATGVNPVSIFSDGGSVVITDLNASASVTNGNRPVVANANGQLMIGAAGANTSWNLTGNAGTVAGTNFLGTTDNVDLVLRANGSSLLTVGANQKIGMGLTPDNYSSHLLQMAGDIRFGLPSNGSNQHFSIAQAPASLSNASAQLPFTLISGNSFLDRSELLLGGNTDKNEAAVQRIRFFTAPLKDTPNGTERMVLDSEGNLGIGTSAPNSTFHVNGSVSMGIVTVSTDYTVNATDHIVIVNCAPNTNIQITLPPAATCKGRIYRLRANTTVDGDYTGQGILVTPVIVNGNTPVANQPLPVGPNTKDFVSDGTNWIYL